jgi:hypothetical protein
MFREEKLYFNCYKAEKEGLKLHKFIFSSTLNLIFSLINRVLFSTKIPPSKCQKNFSVLFWYIAHLRQECHNSNSVIFHEKFLKVLKSYNFLWVQRRLNCSPAASFSNCVMTLYLLKVYLKTFLSITITQKCQILACDTLVANKRYVLTFQTVVSLISCDAVTIFFKLLPIVRGVSGKQRFKGLKHVQHF